MHPDVDLSLPPSLPADDSLAREYLADYWEKELGYNSQAERALIRQMAAARLRLDRCQAAEDAHLKLARDKADAGHLAARRKRARKTAQSLSADPAGTLDKLEATPEGRDWLSNRWRDLDRRLAQALPITDSQRAQAMNLMGYFGLAPGTDAPMFPRQLWAHLHQAKCPSLRYDALGPPMSPHTRASILENFEPPPEVPADAHQARKWLRDLCGAERVRLDRLDREAAEAGPDPIEATRADEESAARHADALVAADDSKAAARRRIEREADASYRANLSLLMRLRHGQQRLREWELKESRRKPPRDQPAAPAPPPAPPVPGAMAVALDGHVPAPPTAPTPAAHHPAHPTANHLPTTTYAEIPPSAPERTNGAPPTPVPVDPPIPNPQPRPLETSAERTRPAAHPTGTPTANHVLERLYAENFSGAPQRTNGSPRPHPATPNSE